MRRTASAVGVRPQPVKGNELRIKKLRKALGQPDAHRRYNPLRTSVATADADQVRCEVCDEQLTLIGTWLFLDSHMCDSCISKLIARGRD